MNSVEDLLAEYRNEVGIATTSFFAWKAINNIAMGEREIFLALNSNALAWNIINHSLLVTFYTALGRIFDEDNRSFTVIGFLSRCENEILQFSKTALEERKIKVSHGVKPEWLDDYLRTSYVPSALDFEAIIELAKQHQGTYTSNYKPIRHKIIAHKDIATIGSKDALFAKTNIGEIQDMLQFLHQVERVVNELYWDGRKSSLAAFTFDREQGVHDDINNLLHKLPIG